MNKFVVHPSFIILLLLSLYSGNAINLIIFTSFVTIHELGHYLSAKLYGLKTYCLHLTIIGGMIEMENNNSLNFFQKTIVNISGILLNFLIIIILKFINPSNCQLYIKFNYLMILVNLIPISPLDGFRITSDLLQIFYDEEYVLDCLYYLSLLILSVISIMIFIMKTYGFYLIIIFLLFKTLQLKTKKPLSKTYFLSSYYKNIANAKTKK